MGQFLLPGKVLIMSYDNSGYWGRNEKEIILPEQEPGQGETWQESMAWMMNHTNEPWGRDEVHKGGYSHASEGVDTSGAFPQRDNQYARNFARLQRDLIARIEALESEIEQATIQRQSSANMRALSQALENDRARLRYMDRSAPQGYARVEPTSEPLIVSFFKKVFK